MKHHHPNSITYVKSDAILPYCGLMAIFSIEYIGLGHYVPGAQKIPLFLSFIIFLWVLVRRNLFEIFSLFQTKALIVFLFHTALSILYAVVSSYAFKTLEAQIGYIILFFSTYFILDNKNKILVFIKYFVFIHIILVIVNASKLASTQRIGNFKAGYFLGDGNDFAWSLTIFLPFCLYLIKISNNKFKQIILIFFAILMTAGIIGTGSRGAFLAVSASILYMVINSKNRAKALLIGIFCIIVAFVFAPQAYIDRVHSIGQYQEDSSALGRIMAWKASVRMAIGHPFGVGAGSFNSAYGRFYRPKEVDTRIYAGQRWISPHSVYFLVLGEYGVIGVITILSLLWNNFRDNQRQVMANAKGDVKIENRTELILLPKYLNMSLVAFSIGGAFLGGINYPHLYILTALIARIRKINENELDNLTGWKK